MVWSEWGLKFGVIFFFGRIASYRGDGLLGRHGGHLDGSLLSRQGLSQSSAFYRCPSIRMKKTMVQVQNLQKDGIGHLLSLPSD